MFRRLASHILLALGCYCAPAHADCYTLAGAQFNRWVYDASGMGAVPVHRDGAVMLTTGYACGVLNGTSCSLDAGASLGSIVDSKNTGASATLGIVLAVDYSDAISVGLVPHWVTSESPRYLDSYGVGLAITTRFSNILNAIGLDFGQGMDAAFKEAAGD